MIREAQCSWIGFGGLFVFFAITLADSSLRKSVPVMNKDVKTEEECNLREKLKFFFIKFIFVMNKLVLLIIMLQ